MNEMQAVNEAVTAVMWYDNSILMTFLGVIVGGIIGFVGTVISSIIKLKEIDNKNKFELEKENRAKRNEICGRMIQSIYSLQRMDDGLIQMDLVRFKDDSYVIMADARMYCSYDVYENYEKFLSIFFREQKYDGPLVNGTLLPAIRKDLGVK